MKDKNYGFLDRVFLHNKNADERLFDLILRSATFIVLLLIVLIYSSISVHADSGSTLMALFDIDSNKLNPEFIPAGNFSNNRAFFNTYDFGYAVQNYSVLNDAFSSMGTAGDPTTFHPPYSWDSNSSPLDFEGVDIDNNFIICCSNYFSGIGRMNGYIAIPKQLFLDGKVLFGRSGNIYAIESFDYQIASTWQALTTRTFTADGSPHVVDLQQALSTANCYFCSCPYWDGIGFINDFVSCSNDILSHNNDPFYYTDTFCNMNYFMYDDVSNMSDSFTPEVESESNLNHLYLKTAEVGLTSSGSGSDLINSMVCIGVGVDDWITAHPDQFYLQVTYDFTISGTIDGVPMATLEHPFSQTLPINTFTNNIYKYGIPQINAQTGLNYDSLSSNGIRVVSSDNYYGLFPIARRSGETISELISNSYSLITSSGSQHTIEFTEFSLSVRLMLFDFSHQGGNNSGEYVKVFDFLTGTESVLDSKIFQNQNPWLGDPSGVVNPYVPSVGGNGSNYPDIYGGGGSSSVFVDVNGNKIPMNVQGKEALENTLNNYTQAHEDLLQGVKDLANEESDNNFVSILGESIPLIPGVNIYMKYVALTCGVLLILLVLKVLLF